ncbi:DUF1573 domain-containing protein [Flavobacterium terrae]|uniref:DUF1573 domain-containing protein n=1 Tax=Flavobacterium terrae TaxID=415425 RepID=A0A1M6GAN4_9FLAO|nr:DUF1573 domain-containing protein [Flavobacterium terrae]SHJ07008.1 Protein of unknown function [Flavobacterium terrae]
MNNKVIGFAALVFVLMAVSCKEKDQFSEIKIDEKNNMVIANDVVTGEVTKIKTTMKPEDYPQIEIENKGEFDFGNINEGDKVEHVFKFKNVGKKGDLVVVDARASCGCTVPEWTKEPLKVGESGEIKIVFNSAGKPGQQSKTVTLTTNTESGHELIKFKANVIPKAK